MNDLEQISLGVIIGVGLVIWLLISAALSDAKRHDRNGDDKKKPPD